MSWDTTVAMERIPIPGIISPNFLWLQEHTCTIS